MPGEVRDQTPKTRPKPEDLEEGGEISSGESISPIAAGLDGLPVEGSAGGQTKSHFYGAVKLDPVRATIDFATVVDEVVQQFTSKLGADVNISVEIQAASNDGFDESLQRTVKEHCYTRKFGNADFEDDGD